MSSRNHITLKTTKIWLFGIKFSGSAATHQWKCCNTRCPGSLIHLFRSIYCCNLRFTAHTLTQLIFVSFVHLGNETREEIISSSHSKSAHGKITARNNEKLWESVSFITCSPFYRCPTIQLLIDSRNWMKRQTSKRAERRKKKLNTFVFICLFSWVVWEFVLLRVPAADNSAVALNTPANLFRWNCASVKYEKLNDLASTWRKN